MEETNSLLLVCNAHLDPVWLWEWEEGCAQALATFRTAAELCQEFDGFVFNHNEALLYKWIEIYDKDLFQKIKFLVKKKKWHIMGGWYLQPDCNLPSGESLVRQILVGNQYFRNTFNVQPHTAVNLDPFGHTRGLVQILKKSGYDSYLFCRPDPETMDLPNDDFLWIGYDGSQIKAHRTPYHYNSKKGKAAQRIKEWLKQNQSKKWGLLLWGVGNHGGGPSREDLAQIKKLSKDSFQRTIKHSTPEDYFEQIKEENLLRYEKDLNPWAVGCYTSMSRIKQKHRKLENQYYLTETMVSHAHINGLMSYPREQLAEALEDLLFCEFHDILPGSCTAEVEESSLQRMGHGLEILSRLKNRAFFALLSGQRKAAPNEFPIIVYNPHPFPFEDIFWCEFQPEEPNQDPSEYWIPELRDNQGRLVPCQLEKESSNISNDHRKKICFRARLSPQETNRFHCTLKTEKPTQNRVRPIKSEFKFKSEKAEGILNSQTGLIDRFRFSGIDFLKPGSFSLKIMADDPDPWGMKVESFRQCIGEFALMSQEQSAVFSATGSSRFPPLRIIEQGPIRTVVEALFQYHHSSACVRYKFSQKESALELEIKLFWNEKDKMVKLSIPSAFKNSTCLGQVPYGLETFSHSEREHAVQKWAGILSEDKQHLLTVINNGLHGFDFKSGELRLSLLRSPAYAAHPVNGMPLVPQDRFEDRMDQGKHTFRFWINIGTAEQRLSSISRESTIKNQAPFILCCFPPGKGTLPNQGVVLEGDPVELKSMKMAEEENWMILRLFEPTGEQKSVKLTVPVIKKHFQLSLSPFEIKTIAIDLCSKQLFFTNLLEQKNDP
ncbi:MAG: alpha-mannosidase [Candidatus Aminicenantes bacterium]|nr:alpha-mannosidase [Candidatus Aminicenantes bacterium]